MNAKQKAEELIKNYQVFAADYTLEYKIKTAKICAILCVEEILKNSLSFDYNNSLSAHEYWNTVLHEIKYYK